MSQEGRRHLLPPWLTAGMLMSEPRPRDWSACGMAFAVKLDIFMASWWLSALWGEGTP